MPVEIKELHIRVAVDARPPQQAGAGQDARPAGGDAGAGGDKDAIVAECVEQVMQILQSKRQR